MNWQQARRAMELGKVVQRPGGVPLGARCDGSPLAPDVLKFPYVDGEGNRFRIVQCTGGEPGGDADSYKPTVQDLAATDWEVA